MGWEAADSMDEALEMAQSFVGRTPSDATANLLGLATGQHHPA